MDCGGIPRSSKRSCERRNGKSFVLDVRGVASRLIIRHARPGLVIDVKELVGHDCGNAVCRLFDRVLLKYFGPQKLVLREFLELVWPAGKEFLKGVLRFEAQLESLQDPAVAFRIVKEEHPSALVPTLTVTQSGCQIFGPLNDALRTPYSVFSLSMSRPSISFCGAVSFDAGMPLGVNMVLKQAATIFPVFASQLARKISM